MARNYRSPNTAYMHLPQYLIEAAQKTTHRYIHFGIRPLPAYPQWLYDPKVTSGKGTVGGGIAMGRRVVDRWNTLRKQAAHDAVKTDRFTQHMFYRYAIQRVEEYNGEETEWFLACKRWTEEFKVYIANAEAREAKQKEIFEALKENPEYFI